MPKYSTFPTLYDNCLQVSISFLKRWGYLSPDQWKSGTITWSRNGIKTGWISITVNTNSESPYLELDYKANGNPIKYKINLVSIPTNISKGVIWFFICPRTGKRCRKLYLVGSHFYHREAFMGCMYEKQTYSHKKRMLFKSFEKVFATENVYEQVYSKHFKSQYAGKPTKRYLKLLKKLNNPEIVSIAELLK